MRAREIAAVFCGALSSVAIIGVAPSQSEIKAMYEKAARELDAGHYEPALQALDAIDARQPDLAEVQNLRGVILMRQGRYDEAEIALQKALEIKPSFRDASFNRAETAFLEKNWAEARRRFAAVVAGPGEDLGKETIELIRYKN